MVCLSLKRNLTFIVKSNKVATTCKYHEILIKEFVKICSKTAKVINLQTCIVLTENH